jgi:hypothetical protein
MIGPKLAFTATHCRRAGGEHNAEFKLRWRGRGEAHRRQWHFFERRRCVFCVGSSFDSTATSSACGCGWSGPEAAAVFDGPHGERRLDRRGGGRCFWRFTFG